MSLSLIALAVSLGGVAQLTIDRPFLIAASKETARVTVRFVGDDGRPVDAKQPELTVSTGTVTELRPLGYGEFVATYSPPAEPYPDLAIFRAQAGALEG